ncbi:hypothetical protein [Segeticoccus rhizosphaerae]|jgi:hypothetical protein|uniref:hypothetical protein n=1 Tax=Segeticoccus rhizosphaerae TaxID=1104777 RepID=UPI0012654A1B|nr:MULTISPECIES: hypothetical protein [Intrasporangiaceae]
MTPTEPGGAGDPGSCSALASRLSGTAYRVQALHHELEGLGVPHLAGDLAELDGVVTDLVLLADAVQRLAADLGQERAPRAPTIRDRTRSGRSHAALARVAGRVRPVP